MVKRKQAEDFDPTDEAPEEKEALKVLQRRWELLNAIPSFGRNVGKQDLATRLYSRHSKRGDDPVSSKSFLRYIQRDLEILCRAINSLKKEQIISTRQGVSWGESGSPFRISGLSDQETLAFGMLKKLGVSWMPSSMREALNPYLPNQIGRFDDSFNINCTGDYFTNRGYATILFEAGHYAKDYNRDEVRKFVFIALKAAISFINENDIVSNDLGDYLNIYQNNKCFYDFIFENVRIYDNNVEKIIKFAVQYKEVLTEGKIAFIPEIIQIENLDTFFAHQTIDFENKLYEYEDRNFPKIGDIIKV